MEGDEAVRSADGLYLIGYSFEGQVGVGENLPIEFAADHFARLPGVRGDEAAGIAGVDELGVRRAAEAPSHEIDDGERCL